MIMKADGTDPGAFTLHSDFKSLKTKSLASGRSDLSQEKTFGGSVCSGGPVCTENVGDEPTLMLRFQDMDITHYLHLVQRRSAAAPRKDAAHGASSSKQQEIRRNSNAGASKPRTLRR